MNSRLRHRETSGVLKTRQVYLAIALLIALCGCEEDVAAVLSSEEAFTVYGVVSPQADTQRVRVYPIEPTLQLAEPEPPDARVTSTDLQTGETLTWTYLQIQEPDGRVAHAYESPFTAAFDHTYRIEVERSDGAVTRVDAIVPPEAEVIPEEPRVSNVAFLPVTIRGGVPRLLKVEVEYVVDFRYAGPAGSNDPVVVIPYDGRQRPGDGGDWTLLLNLNDDFSTIREVLQQRGGAGIDNTYGVFLLGINLRFIAASDAWNPPDDTFDPEILVQPGTLSNVENGFGFVGAGYRMAHRWLPPREAAVAAGFRGIGGD